MEENTISPAPDNGGATPTAIEPSENTTNENDHIANVAEPMEVVNTNTDNIVTQAEEPVPDNKPDTDPEPEKGMEPEKDREPEKSEKTEKQEEYNCTVTVEVDDNDKADQGNVNVSDLIDIEKMSDSELGPESTEKEPNKGLSRELKSLMKSAKESKIISECTQVKTKMRKSRTQDGAEANSIQERSRRSSVNSQKSNSSERSDKTSQKRSMRSSNPDFVNKNKRFLHSLTVKGQKENLDSSQSPHSESELDSGDESKINSTQNETVENSPKCQSTIGEKQPLETSMRLRSDSYCWRCHWSVTNISQEKATVQPPARCTVCPRSLHYKCLTSTERNKFSTDKNWVCPECLAILHAESSNTRSPAMRKISLLTLCELLRYALKRMMDVNGVEPFVNAVDRDVFPDYDKYVVHPMHLTHMSENITAGLYGSTEAFTADALWILHNSIIFNTVQSKLTAAARSLVRSCRTEMAEIETCPECYAAAHARRPTWFTDVCSSPHVLLWAKLKGFPYWPAKGMSVNATGMVDVRFFGAHDRAWVPSRDCYLYCEKDPNNFRTKRQDIIDSMQEAEQHIRTISRKFGSFVHAAFKTPFEPSKINEQLKMMIPGFQGEVTTAVKYTKEKNTSVTSSPLAKANRQRSNSKSSKDSFLDGYASDDDEACKSSSLRRKMADGAEIAREEDENKDNNKTQSVEKGVVVLQSASSTSRKRRRSALEEAVLTVLEDTVEKRKRPDSAKPEDAQKQDVNEEKKDTMKNVSVCNIESMSVDKSANENEPNKKDKVELPQENAKIDEKLKDAVKDIPKIDRLTTRTAEVIVPDTEKDKDQKVVKSVIDEKEKRAFPRAKSSTQKDKSGTEQNRRSRTPRDDNSILKPKSQNRTSKPRKSSTRSDKNAKQTDLATETTSKSQPDKSIISINLVDTPEKPEKVQIRTSTPKNPSPMKSVKDCIIFDDDTTLADLARGGKPNVIVSVPGLPTITSIHSLSRSLDTVETPTQVTSESNVFTPSKDVTTKIQQQRKDDKPLGRVGVRAFARMSSQEVHVSTSTSTEQLQVEIKTEPMEEDERQTEKIDLLNSIKLRPVGQANSANLREVRINKVSQSKIAPRTTVLRPMAKKTFPQPKKPDDGRSELNNKNSMVYIPIQPSSSQGATRVTLSRPGPQSRANGTSFSSTVKSTGTMVTSSAIPPGNMVNTLTTPLMQVACVQPVSAAQAQAGGAGAGPASAAAAGHTIGQVPTNVHTVPLITSVNGQWTFSLQPVMSVGSSPPNEPPPLVNGVSERQVVPAIAPAPSPSAQAPRDTSTAQCNAEAGSQGEAVTLPRLQQRPLLNPLDTSTPIGEVPTPSSAGVVTAKLNQSAVKLADFFRNLLEDSLEKLNEPEAQFTAVKLQLEQERWKHQQEMAELKHNYGKGAHSTLQLPIEHLTLVEMRAAMEKEKSRAISETRRVCQAELEAAVSHTKSRQWCANCRQEAQFYCCWNTSYCDYPCQRAHWAQHFAACSQQRPQSTEGNFVDPSDNRLHSTNTVPSSSAAAAPTLTVGGKVVQPRVYSANSNANASKQSIIVSMIDDGSGNQTVKCLGTYKPNSAQQNTPVLINKQIMNSEDGTKKVVTPGGYIIVSGAGSNPSILLN